jgi:hypothetical protein
VSFSLVGSLQIFLFSFLSFYQVPFSLCFSKAHHKYYIKRHFEVVNFIGAKTLTTLAILFYGIKREWYLLELSISILVVSSTYTLIDFIHVLGIFLHSIYSIIYLRISSICYIILHCTTRKVTDCINSKMLVWLVKTPSGNMKKNKISLFVK